MWKWCLLLILINVSGVLGQEIKHKQPKNIVVNGSFEDPDLPLNSFRYFRGIRGWQTPYGSIEIQSGIVGTSFDGRQFAELDSSYASSRIIFQDIATKKGKHYFVSFAFSSRPSTSKSNNRLRVLWDGKAIFDIKGDSGGRNTKWKVHSGIFRATKPITRLTFQDMGYPADTLGTYIDSVKVIEAPKP